MRTDGPLEEVKLREAATNQEQIAVVEVFGGEIPEPLGQALAEEDDVGPDDARRTVGALRDAVVAL